MHIYTPQNTCFETLVNAFVDVFTLTGELELIANRDRSYIHLSEEELNTPVITKELRDRLISHIERKQATDAEEFFFFNANGDRCYINAAIYQAALNSLPGKNIRHSTSVQALVDRKSGVELTEVNNNVTHIYENAPLLVFEKIHHLQLI